MSWLAVAVVAYALIMLFGGVGGYVSAGSYASLWTGIISGLLLIGSAALVKTNPRAGYTIATIVTLVLIGVFLERYVKTQKVMPSLGLVGLSLLMLILLITGHFLNRRAA